MENRLKKRLFGIQKKLFLYMVGIFAVIGGILFAVIIGIMKNNIYASMERQYQYVNEKAYTHFINKYDEIDKLADSWILNEAVQESLVNKELTANEKNKVAGTLSIFQGTDIDYYMYVDNKFNIYSQKNLKLEEDEFFSSPAAQSLKGYSKTCFYWGEDRFFGGRRNYLFVLRYIRNVERNYEPGILCLRMNSEYLDNILENTGETDSVQLLYDDKGNLCDVYNPGKYELTAKKLKWIYSRVNDSGSSISFGDGLMHSSFDENTGYSIVTYVSPEVLNSYLYEIYAVAAIIGAAALAVMIGLSSMISRKITKPIRLINDYMTHFDNTRLKDYLDIQTNTELDTIGSSYNAMIDRVGGLMDKVREDEKAIREQEIHSLVNQLHPHFLYNTLDTIYMLARISHEDTIMKMIYALSKYLRINLSKGANEIPVYKELEHVCAYMDIQKIRNDGLFDYTAECDEAAKYLKICKLILQPLAENAVKHGFKEISEDGLIHICVRIKQERLVMTVENNGEKIAPERLAYLNSLEKMSQEQLEKNAPKGEGGYGLINIVTRLKLNYGDGVRFYYTSDETTVCTVEIPVQMLGEEGRP